MCVQTSVAFDNSANMSLSYRQDNMGYESSSSKSSETSYNKSYQYGDQRGGGGLGGSNREAMRRTEKYIDLQHQQVLGYGRNSSSNDKNSDFSRGGYRYGTLWAFIF